MAHQEDDLSSIEPPCSESTVSEKDARDFKPAASTDADALRMHAASTWTRAKLRMPAILLTFCIEMVVAFVISKYQDTLKAYPLLISFQPVVSAISGNVGLQSSSIIVRNLAVGINSETHFRKALMPELKVGFLIASFMTGVVGLTALFWYAPVPDASSGHTWLGSAVFGATIGLGIFVSMVLAALSGTSAPLLAKRCGFDPSAMSGPMETAFQDIAGSTFLLAMGSLLLHSFGDHGRECPGGSASVCFELCKLAMGNSTSVPYDPRCIQSCISDIAAGLC
jgi:magnesium transporter